jgi:hypothetical protein
MNDHDPRNTDDRPEPRCNCCGAFLRIEGHSHWCETLSDQDLIESADLDQDYIDGGSFGNSIADDGQA